MGIDSSISDPVDEVEAAEGDGNYDLIPKEAADLISQLQQQEDDRELDELFGDDDDETAESSVAEEDETNIDDNDVDEEVPVDKVVALQKGWMDNLEDWVAAGKDPKEWVDYPEFNRRQKLFDKIHEQGQEIKDLKRMFRKELQATIRALKQNQVQDALAGYEQTEQRLVSEYKQAMEEGDAHTALQIRDKLDNLRERAFDAKRKLEVEESEADQISPEDFDNPVEWLEASNPELARGVKTVSDNFRAANSWYESDAALTKYADSLLATKLEAVKGVKDQNVFKRVLEDVGKEVRETFPHHPAFRKTVRTKSPVKKGGQKNAQGGEDKKSLRAQLAALPPEAQRAAKMFAKQGIMSVEDYLKDWNNG